MSNVCGLARHSITEQLSHHNLGLFPHMGGSKGKALQDDSEKLLLNKLRLGETNTAPNVNKFGEHLEDLGIAHVCCANHEMHGTCKKVFQKNQEGVFGARHAKSWEKARCLPSKKINLF